MSRTALPGGFRLQHYRELPSTSDLCIRLAAGGEPVGLAVLADEQTAGRGRNGRRWESPAGNLFLSVLLRPEGDAGEAARASLLAGVALFEALAGFLPAPAALSLKWPNDLLLEGRKLAGILTESASHSDGKLAWLVIGFGANLVAAPAIPGRATACMRDATTTPPVAEAVAHAVLAELAHWLAVQSREGFAAIRAAWLQRAHPPGTPLLVNRAGGSLSGQFAGLAESGALLLATASGITVCNAGEVLESSGGLACCS